MRAANYTTETADKVIFHVCHIAADLLGIPVISAQRIGGSGNNRVYFLQCDNSRSYVAKFYFRHPSDKRDRLKAEFDSLSFLHGQWIVDVPRPVAVGREESCAIYEFIEGKKIKPEDISTKDIECAVDFLGRIKKLNSITRAVNFPPASDACFSVQATIESVEGRLGRFESLKEEGEEYGELKSFLQDDFKPLLITLTEWARQQCKASGISFDVEIPMEQRTLSPSDFGFHNAIRTSDGRVVFLDFEYFGWDDPAKTIVDFLFHPAMALKESMKKIFVRGMLETFKENGRLIERIRMAYPLFGLKWCMIFLNEFIPNDFSRRVYAAASSLDRNQVQREQLGKAKDLHRHIKEAYSKFPYAN